MVTLATDDFNAHARMSVPADRVKLDISSNDRFVKVGVFHVVRIRVSIEQLHGQQHAPSQASIYTELMLIESFTK